MKARTLACILGIALTLAAGAAPAGEQEIDANTLAIQPSDLTYPNEPPQYIQGDPNRTPVNGVAKKWYRNQVGERLEYEATIKDGYARSMTNYHDEPDRIVAREQTLVMEDGNEKGRRTEKTYHRGNGKLKSEESYTITKGASGAAKDGLFREYHENGNLMREETYVNGKKNGLAKTHLKDGTLSEETTYQDGKRNGPSREYHKNGVLKKEVGYLDDKEHGVRTDYRDNGSLQQTQEFKNGRADGPKISYARDGETVTETKMFKDGRPVNQ